VGLSEADIRRYARQILLTPVGGTGQERLLARGTLVIGHGRALEVARTYLSAGGTPTEGGEGRLGACSERFEGEGPWVALGQRGTQPVVAFRGTGGCPQCFAATMKGCADPVDTASSIFQGTVAALCFQRLVLGLGAEMGLVTLDETGHARVEPGARCGGHA
jgi:hypothetical protein